MADLNPMQEDPQQKSIDAVLQEVESKEITFDTVKWRFEQYKGCYELYQKVLAILEP